MFLLFKDLNNNDAGINLDDLNYYTIDSGGHVRVYVGLSSLNFVYADGTNEKTKFLNAVKSKKVLALENTSTDVYLIPSRIKGWTNIPNPTTSVYMQDDVFYIYDSTDIATFQSYMDGVGK